MVYRSAPNLKDSLVSAKLSRIQIEVAKGCFRCGKSCNQVCSFISNVSGKRYSITVVLLVIRQE